MTAIKVTPQEKDEIETLRLPLPRRLTADLDDYRKYLDRDTNGRTQTTRQHIIRQVLEGLFDGDKAFKRWQEEGRAGSSARQAK